MEIFLCMTTHNVIIIMGQKTKPVGMTIGLLIDIIFNINSLFFANATRC